jgi:hypothetical protein
MFWQAFKYAVIGSFDRANTAAPIVGAFIVWLVMSLLGLDLAIPADLGGTLVLLVATLGTSWIVVVTARFLYWPWSQLSDVWKNKKSDLVIRYDYQDGACLKFNKNLYGTTGEFYSIWLENIGEKTLEKVSLRASEGWFAQHAIHTAQTGRSARYQKPVPIYEVEELHPDAPEKIEMFGLSYATDSTNADYIFNTVQRFTLEARAKDTKTIRKTFEYNPQTRPMVLAVDD